MNDRVLIFYNVLLTELLFYCFWKNYSVRLDLFWFGIKSFPIFFFDWETHDFFVRCHFFSPQLSKTWFSAIVYWTASILLYLKPLYLIFIILWLVLKNFHFLQRRFNITYLLQRRSQLVVIKADIILIFNLNFFILVFIKCSLHLILSTWSKRIISLLEGLIQNNQVFFVLIIFLI